MANLIKNAKSGAGRTGASNSVFQGSTQYTGIKLSKKPQTPLSTTPSGASKPLASRAGGGRTTLGARK